LIKRDSTGAIEKYTEFYSEGRLVKEVRLTGKDHSEKIPRPNVKEPNYNINPKTGEKHLNGYKVRAAKDSEIPKSRKR
jgi:hypothetical protein